MKIEKIQNETKAVSNLKGGFKMKKLLVLACVLAVMAFAFTACDRNPVTPPGDDVTTTQAVGGETTTTTVVEVTTTEPIHVVPPTDPFYALQRVDARFPSTATNANPIIDGGTLRWAIGTSATLPGIFCAVHFISALDSNIRDLFAGSMFAAGMDSHVDNTSSLVYTEFCRETQTITFTMQHEAFWHDGVQVTMDDLYFAIWIIAHPDYTGTRWGPNISNIVGAEEFRAGNADYISGMVLSEDKMTLTLHMIDFPFTISAFGWWSAPVPRHHWEGIAVADMMGHENARTNALGFGPFIIDAVVPGESVSVRRNENYWRGRPHLDGIVVNLVEATVLPMALQQGLYDIGTGFPASQFTEHFRYMTNVEFLSNVWAQNGNSFLGFRVGTWDSETGEVYTFEEPRLSETVRRALALSVDHSVAYELFNGLTVPTGSSWYGLRNIHWIDTEIPTYNHFDPEYAMRMLDEAGYLRGPDGFRTFPDGRELTITYLALTGSPANDTERAMELQNWADIGLRVEFYQGRQVDSAVGSDVRFREADGGVVDMWWFGWNLGANPMPQVMTPGTQNNQVRYRSEHWDYIFDRFMSDDMWDPDFLLETVNMWQWAVHDAAVIFPWRQAVTLSVANNRVANFSLEITGDYSRPHYRYPFHWALTSQTAYVDGR